MVSWLSSATDSRLFVDLIHSRSSKLANWEPSFAIRLGDYGYLRKSTGEFERMGNVFDNPELKAPNMKIEHGLEDDRYTIISLDVQELSSENGPEVEIPGIVTASLKAKFRFGRSRGAMLLMSQPKTSKLEGYDAILRVEKAYELLKDMCLVTQIVTCPAYAMYLSSKKHETLEIALQAAVPIAGAVGITAGGEVGGGWHYEGASGVFRCGSHARLGETFTPLFFAKSIGKRWYQRRDDDDELVHENYWMTSVLPWNPLNEDGEEDNGHIPLTENSKDGPTPPPTDETSVEDW